ncbi:hypothetical protein [Pseudoalteromonas sp. SR41-7]|uniref:hypothetical protein n=1 Tax=Pseudoalteromonas sp. SR41-7 TaxID=2760947 RepID=UPI001601E303|nr:hypothetical protein [Pseudoalteromonas sp. SR41-7]MBB1299231.1 hypothetical protein [Pseudoalteromonas sp. SR41-7]
MLLATLVSSALGAATAHDEAKLFSSNTVVCQDEICNMDLNRKFADKLARLDETLLKARSAYFEIANSDDLEAGTFENMADLETADVLLRAVSQYLKRNWAQHNEEIYKNYGREIHENIKSLVAKTAQLRKNISNILRVLKEAQGQFISSDHDEFTPSVEFFTAADIVTNRILNIH